MSQLRIREFFVTLVIVCGIATAKVIFSETDSTVIVQNGYTYLAYNKLTASIETIAADFSGNGAYSENNLARPFALQVSESQGEKTSLKCSSNRTPKQNAKLSWLEKSSDLASFRVSNIVDNTRTKCNDGKESEENPIATEEWTISLAADERAVTVDISGQILRDASVNYILHGIYSNSPSLYGLFPKGVAQMMGNTDACMGSPLPLSRAYVLGNGAAMDILRHNYGDKYAFDAKMDVTDGSTATGSPSTVVFKSAHPDFGSGIEDVLFGTYPSITTQMTAAWTKTCWNGTVPVAVTAGTTWSFGLTFLPNNYDFPAYLLNNVTATATTVPFEQLRAYLTGAYASPAGCLQSYYGLQFGTIAPTISHPDVGYSPDTNFFDPDNFISLSALLYTGDAYFLRQVKYVLFRTAETMCGIGKEQVEAYCNTTVGALKEQAQLSASGRERNVQAGRPHKLHSTSRFQYDANEDDVNTRTGQLMHHFVNLIPTYESIAGSEQLGPNVFWTFTVLNYVAITQDTAFASAIFPYVDLSTRYVLSFYDAEMGLFRAPGPLWIDVIVRENYTSDSNGMLVPYLTRVADFYDFMHIDADFANELRDISATVAASIRTKLFDTQTYDHFITQLNPDGSIRDFVDYDSNLMTVAFGIITDPAQIHRVLKRVDSGPYTHVRGTWCSEVPYSGDAMDCYIVGGDVCGDSVVTLARIGWVDALARKRVGDLQTFQQLLLEPLQQDLLNDVWLYERYNASGDQIRTPFYFEYPSLVVMMLREVQYGIDIGLHHVDINPFPHRAYILTLGLVSVTYAPEQTVLSLPGDWATASDKVVTLGGMTAGASYEVTNSCVDGDAVRATASTEGVLQFTTKFATGCTVTATQVPVK